jgi:hypothetical protein
MLLHRQGMNGYHVLWTKPLRKESDGLINVSEFEALTWVLSVLSWKRFVGPVYICTDSRGELFLARTGLRKFYDGVIVCLNDLRSHLIN